MHDRRTTAGRSGPANRSACARSPQAACARPHCRLGWAGAIWLVLVAAVAAEQFNQTADGRQDSGADLAPAASSGYEQQQQQAGGKAKRIQIVYIKVPLAKLRPSLGQYGAPANYSAKFEQQHEPTEAKSGQSAGSQTAADEQQQLGPAELAGEAPAAGEPEQPAARRARQQQSFLIPMALVQSGEGADADAESGAHESAGEPQRRPSLPPSGPAHAPAEPGGGAPGAGRRSPMQMHQQLRSAPAPLGQGFMSSFLSGEKEKMIAAAMRLQQSASAPAAEPAPEPAGRPEGAPAPRPQAYHGPGGLMPANIVPLSRLPDSAIGQAYGAAVGSALPAESGSPSSLVGSPSTTSNNYGKPRANSSSPAANNYPGGASGTPSDAAFSSGTGSSGSYGTGGPGQPGSGSSGSGYQQFASNFAGTGPSSGYGSGTSTYGASAAFSDYPAGPSAASNSNYNHPSSQPAGHSDHMVTDYGANQRLKQAKKTIIPIVVQVEHAILESANAAAQAYQQQQRGNKYGAGRSHRQLADAKRARYNKDNGQQQAYRPNGGHSSQLYGAATNDIAHFGDLAQGAQFINAANSHDINQITAQINAENAASAAAALAQADMAFGPSPAGQYAGAHLQPGRPGPHRPQAAPSAGAQYAAGLQSAASALLANTHPVIQAAASGGLASVSKLGAKLGEIIALPSMQVPSSISSIGASLPSAFSSLTNQVGQAVQQVAKEHPTAHAFARQVAQQAGIQLPSFVEQTPGAAGQAHPGAGQQQLVAASSQQPQSQLAPQLQNLRLNIGQNIQTAAAQLMGVHQKANQVVGLQSSLLGANQMALNAALKQLSAISPAAAQLAGQLAGVQPGQSQQQQSQTALANPQQLNNAMEHHLAASSSIVPVQQQLNQFLQQQQAFNQLASGQQQAAAGETAGVVPADSASGKPGKSSSFKSKFLSFFQPPKFISSLLSWNDRADERQDQGAMSELVGVDEHQTGGGAAKSGADQQDNPTSSETKQQKEASLERASNATLGLPVTTLSTGSETPKATSVVPQTSPTAPPSKVVKEAASSSAPAPTNSTGAPPSPAPSTSTTNKQEKSN